MKTAYLSHSLSLLSLFIQVVFVSTLPNDFVFNFFLFFSYPQDCKNLNIFVNGITWCLILFFTDFIITHLSSPVFRVPEPKSSFGIFFFSFMCTVHNNTSNFKRRGPEKVDLSLTTTIRVNKRYKMIIPVSVAVVGLYMCLIVICVD